MRWTGSTRVRFCLLILVVAILPSCSGDGSAIEEEFKRRGMSPLRTPVEDFPLGTLVDEGGESYVWKVNAELESDLERVLKVKENRGLLENLKLIERKRFNVARSGLTFLTGGLAGRYDDQTEFTFEPGEATTKSFNSGVLQIVAHCKEGGDLRKTQEQYCNTLLDAQKKPFIVLGTFRLHSITYRFYQRGGRAVSIGKQGTPCTVSTAGSPQTEGATKEETDDLSKFEIKYAACWQNDSTLVVGKPFVYALDLAQNVGGELKHRSKTTIIFMPVSDKKKTHF